MKYSALFAFSTLTLATSAAAAPQAFDARSRAMGGTSVASTNFWTAPLNNPAFLARPKPEDSWGMIIPTFGIEISDQNDFVESLEDFADAYDAVDEAYDENNLPDQEDLDELADSLGDLDDRRIDFRAGAGLTLAIPSNNLGIGVVISTEYEGLGQLDIADADLDAIRNANDNMLDELPELESEAIVVASGRTEVGVSLAREFEIAGQKVAIGITPKAQRLETFNFIREANEFEEDENGEDVEFTDDEFRKDESAFNLDVGLATSPTENWTVGLMLSDLIAQDFDSETVNNRQFTYKIEPGATVGTAYKMGSLLLAADLDLVERQPFARRDGNQFASVGAELAWRWAQIRAGFRTDLGDGSEDVFTAGLGFSPFGAIRFDLAGAVGEDTYGAGLQISMSF